MRPFAQECPTCGCAIEIMYEPCRVCGKTEPIPPLTDDERSAIEARLAEHATTLIDRSSSEGGPAMFDNPLADDVRRLLLEVRRLRGSGKP